MYSEDDDNYYDNISIAINDNRNNNYYTARS